MTAALAERAAPAGRAAAAEDARWMAAALALARRGLGVTAPNPSVGAIVVTSDGLVAGRGWTQPGGRPHAETIALARAAAAARGATLYVTLEPCSHYGKTPPCVDAVIAAGIARVVAATADPDPRVDGRGFERLRAAGIALTIGVGEQAARRLNVGHFTRATLGRPHVTLKLAVSADEKVGLPGRRPVAISCEISRARTHMVRAESDAIMIGVGTALADDPSLTCRLPGMAARSPIRVVLDADLRLPPEARLASTARETPTWVMAASDAPAERERALREKGVEVMRVDRTPGGGVRLDEAMRLLGLRGVTRVLAEGGPTVAVALLDADLVDAAIIVRGKATLGEGAVDALEGRPLAALTASPRLAKAFETVVGADLWTGYERR